MQPYQLSSRPGAKVKHNRIQYHHQLAALLLQTFRAIYFQRNISPRLKLRVCLICAKGERLPAMDWPTLARNELELGKQHWHAKKLSLAQTKTDILVIAKKIGKLQFTPFRQRSNYK